MPSRTFASALAPSLSGSLGPLRVSPRAPRRSALEHMAHTGSASGASREAAPAWGARPYEVPLTALGVLKRERCPWYPFLEWRQRMDLKHLLTEAWPSLQGGKDRLALEDWKKAVETLELDGEAIQDLFLLIAQGRAGRAEANEILWDLMSHWALVDRDHRDLSRKCSSMVNWARKIIDRPPATHEDRAKWTYRASMYPRNAAFDPFEVPADPRVLTGRGGVPLRPPACWGAPPPPPYPQAPPAASQAPQAPPEPPARTWGTAGGRASRWGAPAGFN